MQIYPKPQTIPSANPYYLPLCLASTHANCLSVWSLARHLEIREKILYRCVEKHMYSKKINFLFVCLLLQKALSSSNMSRTQGILKFRISTVQQSHDFLITLIFNHSEVFSCCDSIMGHYVNMSSTKVYWGKKAHCYNFKLAGWF